MYYLVTGVSNTITVKAKSEQNASGMCDHGHK